MCVDPELPRGDSGAAEKPYQQRPQQQGWQGALWGPALGWGQRVSASPAAWCWVCWHWVLAAARSHPGCALQVLLEEEPRDHLHTAVRQQAMLAIAALRYLPSPWFGWHLSTARGPGPGQGHPPSRQSPVVPSEGLSFALLVACWEGAGEGRGILQLPAVTRLFPKAGGGRQEACLPGLSFGPGHVEEGGGASWQSSLHTHHPSQGPLLQRSVSTCPRHRGTTPSTSVQHAPLSLCSKVEMVLEGKKESLLQACFRSVFLLPPKTDMQGLVTTLYFEVSAG